MILPFVPCPDVMVGYLIGLAFVMFVIWMCSNEESTEKVRQFVRKLTDRSNRKARKE